MFVARAAATAGAAATLLAIAPLPVAVRVVVRRPHAPIPVPTLHRIVALTDRVLATARPQRPRCVLRSLVLMRYLPEGAGQLVLRFGVRPEERPLAGHAWVEREGEPLFEVTDPRLAYRVTWSWPT